MLTPWPRLILEYAPFGTLEGKTFTIEDAKKIFVQGTSALVDLHERTVPIVHRDIKPANILLSAAEPPHIKFTDFGLSTVESKLATFCGTKLYLAPEVHKDKPYTSSVDIWSFGLVVFECAYGLPARPRKCSDEEWCEMMVEKVNDWEDDELIDILSGGMIIVDPTMRFSTRDCHEAAQQIASTRGEQPEPRKTYHATGGTYTSSEATTVRARSASGVWHDVLSVPATDLFGYLHGRAQKTLHTKLEVQQRRLESSNTQLMPHPSHNVGNNATRLSNTNSKTKRYLSDSVSQAASLSSKSRRLSPHSMAGQRTSIRQAHQSRLSFAAPSTR